MEKTKHKTNQKFPFLREADWEDGWGRTLGWGEVRKHLPPSSNVCLLGLQAAVRTAETRGLCVGRWCFSNTHTHIHVCAHTDTQLQGFRHQCFCSRQGSCVTRRQNMASILRARRQRGRYRHALNNVINYTKKTKHLIYRQSTPHHSLWKSPVKIMKHRNKWNETWKWNEIEIITWKSCCSRCFSNQQEMKVFFGAFHQMIDQSTLSFTLSEMRGLNLLGKKHLRITENNSPRWQRWEKKFLFPFVIEDKQTRKF